MEDESGLDSPSNVKLLTFAEMADELCPYYMSMGVPYNEYWHGDYTQLKFYTEAYRLQLEHENYSAWLQGAYVYEAVCAVSPILHAFAKSGTRPLPYLKEAYGMKADKTNAGATEAKTEKEIQEIQALNASAKFASFMTQWNKRFESEGGGASGTDD